MVVAIVALFAALSGTAYAGAGQELVGIRQLKSKAVTSGKIANNAMTSAKVAQNALTGEDINLCALGTVPSATSAACAGNANTVGGHSAACPSGTTLIRGVCFDASSKGPVEWVNAAEDPVPRGRYLPTPLELYSTRKVINLGSGAAPNAVHRHLLLHRRDGLQLHDHRARWHRADAGTGRRSPSKYVCAYSLVR